MGSLYRGGFGVGLVPSPRTTAEGVDPDGLGRRTRSRDPVTCGRRRGATRSFQPSGAIVRTRTPIIWCQASWARCRRDGRSTHDRRGRHRPAPVAWRRGQARRRVRSAACWACIGVAAAASGAATAAVLPPSVPVGVTAAGLRALVGSVGHPVYWLGARPGYSYELTETWDGRTYVRYLPRGVSVGDRRPMFLVVGTYPLKNALTLTEAAAKRLGVNSFAVGRDGIGFVGKPAASVFCAFRRTDLQIEVFSPVPSQARRAVHAGKLQPVR
jgi:hypothetical protein